MSVPPTSQAPAAAGDAKAEPAAKKKSRRERRHERKDRKPFLIGRRATVVSWASKVLIAIGVLFLLFIGFELVIGGLAHTEDQGRLLSQFKTLVASGRAAKPTWHPTPGQPIAQIAIPKIGVQEVVVQDTTPELMKGGPGHFLNTPLPGYPGNSVIAGRRVSHGGVFRHLGDLAVGDAITLITPQGAFAYEVGAAPHIVAAGQPDVFAPTTLPTLTLVTSDSAFSTRGRLVVTATLQGSPLTAVPIPVIQLTRPQLGLAGDTGAVVAIIPWALAFIVALFGARALRRRVESRKAFLFVALPAFLFVLFFLFENIDRLLPGTI